MARAKKKNDTGANLGFEAKLWLAADKMRNNMDAAEYEHVVLGLIFLKYISDAFEEHHHKLEDGTADPDSEWYVKDVKQRYMVLEDRDEYLAANIFWVPKEARWSYLQAYTKQTAFGMPLVTAKVVKGGRIETPDEFIADEDYDEWMRRGLPEANDVVMTTEAPRGEIAQLDGRKAALAQRLITLRGIPGVLDNTFLKFLMQSSFVQDQLLAVSRDDDWTGWCEFFLVALTRQAEMNHAKAVAIMDLYRRKKDWITELTHSQYAIRALDWFFGQPIFKASDFMSAAGIPKATAKRIVRLARERGLLRELDSGRGRRASVLAFSELLNIAEGREVF